MTEATSGYNGEQMTDYQEDMDWEQVGNPPPAHDFNLECKKADHAFSKSSGKHMIKAVFEIIGYDPKNDDEKYLGRSLFVNFNFTSAGGFLTKAFFLEAGLELPRTINKALLEEQCQYLVGVKIGARLKHRTFQDQVQADVSKFMPLLDVGNQISSDEEEGVVDNTAGDEEQEALDAAPPEETEEETPPPPPMRRSLREAAAQAPAAAARPKANGHTNGTANGAAAAARRPAAPAPTPAKKSAAKPQARR